MPLEFLESVQQFRRSEGRGLEIAPPVGCVIKLPQWGVGWESGDRSRVMQGIVFVCYVKFVEDIVPIIFELSPGNHASYPPPPKKKNRQTINLRLSDCRSICSPDWLTVWQHPVIMFRPSGDRYAVGMCLQEWSPRPCGWLWWSSTVQQGSPGAPSGRRSYRWGPTARSTIWRASPSPPHRPEERWALTDRQGGGGGRHGSWDEDPQRHCRSSRSWSWTLSSGHPSYFPRWWKHEEFCNVFAIFPGQFCNEHCNFDPGSSRSSGAFELGITTNWSTSERVRRYCRYYYGFQTVCKCPFWAFLVTLVTDSYQTWAN